MKNENFSLVKTQMIMGKMVIFSLVVILFFITSSVLSQVAQHWVARYNGPGYLDDEANSIVVDGSGNVYVTGFSLGSGTGYDYCTIKYNSSGVEQWVARYNGPGNGIDEAYSIAIDGFGNVYVTGYSTGSVTGYDYCTIKYNSSGDTVWVRRYNGPGNGDDKAYSIAVDGSGNVYVTGWSYGSGTNADYCTIKYNSAGVQQWVARYNGPGNGDDVANSITLDGSGNVYVTGYRIYGATYKDYCTIKYNSSGVQQWVAIYNGPVNHDDEANSIAVDGSGNVYVTGNSDGGGTSYDYCTIKYNSAGVQQWVARYNGPGNEWDIAYSIAVDGSGNVYVTGYSSGSGTYADYCTIKYNSSGVQQWIARYNGLGYGDDVAYSLALDGSGNVYVTGSSYGSGTNADYCTIKYNSAGVQQWIARYNGPGNGDDEARSIAVDGSGNVYVTGNCYGGGTSIDYCTIKYVVVQTPIAPILYRPGNNTQDWNTSLTLIWYKVSIATNYYVQVATDSLFNTLIVNDSTLTDSTKAISGLQTNTWYYWRVNGRNSYGQGQWSATWMFKTKPVVGLQVIGNEIPNEFKLIQNYPNPFNPITKIRFDLPKNANVKLTIYDMLGREIETLVNEQLNAGRYEVAFDGTKYTSGVYYYRLNAGEFVETKKMILVK